MAIEGITEQLKARFPLLTNLFLQESIGDKTPQPLPQYLGIFLAVFEKATAPLCFVLPRRGDIVRLSAVLYGMNQLVLKEKQLTQSFAEVNFNSGDLVRIHPGRQVFRYGGYDSTCPDRIWLETINGSGKWQVRAADVVNRLERTTECRPVGRLNSPILSPPATPLDSLLGTSFYGNHSLFKNELLILDSVAGFENFADRCGLMAGPQTCDAPKLKAFFPFGRISSGEPNHPEGLSNWDQRSSSAEPVIAVTHLAELLANYCIDQPARSKLVVVNGIEHIRHIQSYDDISQTQRLVAFTDHDDTEMIETLASRGCKFWSLDGRELVSSMQVSVRGGLFESVERWAKNYATLTIDDSPCGDVRLDEIWHKLDTLRATTASSDDDTPLTRLVYRAWRLFLSAVRLWDTPTARECADALGNVAALRQDLKQNCAWIATESAHTMTEIADGLASCYTPGSVLGVNKRRTLLSVIEQAIQENKKIALMVRNEAKVGELHRWLSGQNLLTHARVYSPKTLPLCEVFDRVVCVSWLGGKTMQQVVAKLAARHVTVIGYACERHWLRQCQPRFRKSTPPSMLSGDEKSALLSGEKQPEIIWTEEDVQTPPRIARADESDIWEFEYRLRAGRIGLATRPTDAAETLPARYVRFSGNCYAFLTETHKLPVATDFVSGRTHSGQVLPERILLEIEAGDFIVFPESGERELLHDLADKLIGPTADQLRTTAHFWKDALLSSGLSPAEFLQQANKLMRPRHIVTIRNWFGASTQIGPREEDDLVLIALVTNDERLEREIDNVWSAIEQLRSAHQSAGMRLRDVLLQRLPQVIGQVEEDGTNIDLGELGSAWVVRVESIETESEPRGRAEVNRLLFEKISPEITDLLRDLS